ncbi:protein of unknown function [Tenacibaculum sp. 190524A02b]|uniref:hypothetical protein n=1 Tax=Tenacibaculum vairaonense TaxID=3137860 RepID=UPI0032B2F2F2
MKINVNNFKGHLLNGNQYQINSPRIKYSSFYCEYNVKVTVSEFIDDSWFEITDYSVERWYSNPKDFQQNIRECLLELEHKMGITLLKGELEVVAA